MTTGATVKWLGVGVLGLGITALVTAQAPPKDPVLQAMLDELDRSKKVTLSNLEPPYFVQYLLDDSENLSISASLGGIVSRRREHFRQPEVRVRVGDYKFDNTNFGGGGFGGGGTRYDLERFPLDSDYKVSRRYFWLETDSAYKAAVEAISRKRATLRNLTQSDAINDFAHAQPTQHMRELQPLTIDENAWTSRVRSLSAVFAKFPGIKNSSVELEASTGGYTMVNSEGTQVREPEDVTYLRVRAISQAADGTTLRDSITFHALDASKLPSDAEMTRGITEMAENLVALAKAPRGEDYSGPVLFEGVAGPQILAEVMGKNFVLPRRPAGDGGRGGGGFTPSEYEGRIGARVLPDSFDVTDDPTQKEWHGKPLFGSYEVDREGVMPKPLRLVEKGELKGYLLTRQPVRGYEGSNGRARLPGGGGSNFATISNLFVTSSNTVPAAELKKKLIDLIQTRNKPYGIIVRKMDFPSSASFDEVRRILTAAQGGRPVSMPILAFKVYPDGHEELVRGLRFRGLNARSLKDILAAGDNPTAFDFMDNSAPFALIGATGYTTEACVIAPSILIDDLEMHPSEEELPKLPVVPAPEITK